MGQGEYAEFTRTLAEEAVSKAIRDLLLGEYVSRKKRPASGTSTCARLARRALHDGGCRFFASITHLAHETVSWRLFLENIIVSRDRDQPFLYIRNVYERLYDRLRDELTAVTGVPQAVVRSGWVDRTTARNTRRRHVGAIVTGTSGIGKTLRESRSCAASSWKRSAP